LDDKDALRAIGEGLTSSREGEGERKVGGSVLVNPESPPSIEPRGFFGGLCRDFLIVTLERSGRGLEEEFVTMRGKGERGARVRVEEG
jgi:hypothetical protein